MVAVQMAFGISNIVILAFLWILRVNLQDLSGQDYSENKWGFGQVVALIVWVPLFLEVVYEGFGKLYLVLHVPGGQRAKFL